MDDEVLEFLKGAAKAADSQGRFAIVYDHVVQNALDLGLIELYSPDAWSDADTVRFTDEGRKILGLDPRRPTIGEWFLAWISRQASYALRWRISRQA